MTTPTGRPSRSSMFAAAMKRTAGAAPAAVTASAEPRPSRARLLDLADRLATVGRVGVLDLQDGDLRALEQLARAAAFHGWPQPALARLGEDAQGVAGARTSDPSTSKAADSEMKLKPSLKNQLGKLLVALSVRDSTSEEAAAQAGISPDSEYAKRVSQLQALGYVRPVLDDQHREVTRTGAAGRQRLVFTLTEPGRDLARKLVAEAVTVLEER